MTLEIGFLRSVFGPLDVGGPHIGWISNKEMSLSTHDFDPRSLNDANTSVMFGSPWNSSNLAVD